jgi:hypothetical protein
MIAGAVEDERGVGAGCDAWNFFARDPDRIASITTRSWASVTL